jgi:hypothetical protein
MEGPAKGLPNARQQRRILMLLPIDLRLLGSFSFPFRNVTILAKHSAMQGELSFIDEDSVEP